MGSPSRPFALVAVALLVVSACGQGRPSSVPVAGSVGPAATPSASSRGTTRPAPSGSATPGASPSGEPFDPARVKVTLDSFVDGLSAPLAIANAGDGSDRLFVAEQD